jgi:hypothetical protein
MLVKCERGIIGAKDFGATWINDTASYESFWASTALVVGIDLDERLGPEAAFAIYGLDLPANVFRVDRREGSGKLSVLPTTVSRSEKTSMFFLLTRFSCAQYTAL